MKSYTQLEYSLCVLALGCPSFSIKKPFVKGNVHYAPSILFFLKNSMYEL